MMRGNFSLRRAGAIITAVGGAVAAIACFLVWADVAFDLSEFGAESGSESFNGLDITGGKVLLAASAGLVAIAVAIWFARELRGRLALGALAAVGGLFVGVSGIVRATSTESDFARKILLPGTRLVARSAGVSLQEARELVRGAFEQGLVQVSPKLGVWLVVVGGFVAAIGGLLVLVSWLRRAAILG